ncbi:SIR2 family NAD-dependent protein deacylase [Enterobacter hormaechei]|nr:SIR2 family protein [Enterobacter hormaechei]
MHTRFTSLPDYPALKKLASALWEQDNTYHGAAVMVGAGFSRVAASTHNSNIKLPLWNDFLSLLTADLNFDRSNASHLPGDPIRLAEEYHAYFGKQALHELIKKEVNDAAWSPGVLHKDLLALPWTEVLTTNWDTLLERAADEVHERVYSIVSAQEGLANARSPRIVKLHGTIDVTNELIFTQEDYRQYPQKHAAFVNFSRQVFIENELCLLGFSGDDPNFLQWAGWVRDNLANHSRRIYLAGPLGLNAAKRKYLESINVAPIDLAPLVSDFDDQGTRHTEATKLFIKYLADAKPTPAYEWRPNNFSRGSLSVDERKKAYNDSSLSAKHLENQLPALRDDRNSYPGWLVAPAATRWELQNQISSPGITQKFLSEMSHESKTQLLYEVACIYSKTFQIAPSWVVKELLEICNPAKPCVLGKKQQLEIALLLLKSTRWMDANDAVSITEQTSSFLEQGIRHWPECEAELAYHRAIVARDSFDFLTLKSIVDKFVCIDPVWKLRKASLLAELGEFSDGEALVAEAYSELLRQHRNNRNTVYTLSRLAWAQWILRGIEQSSFKSVKPFPAFYQEAKCSPWDHIQYLENRIAKLLENQTKRQEVELSFEPGRYKDNSKQQSLSNELHPLLILDGVTITAGLPLRWKNTAFLVQQVAKLIEIDNLDTLQRFRLAIMSAKDNTSPVLNKVFSRVDIALVPQKDIDNLLLQCRQAIMYWGHMMTGNSSTSRHFAIDRLQVFMEVMSRASVRATPGQARDIFKFILTICKKNEFQNWWLFDTLKNLTEYVIRTIPQSQHSEILLEALLFPLEHELSLQDDHSRKEWVNPVINHPGQRHPSPALNRRIDEIIDSISLDSKKNAPILLRLLPLIKNQFLTDQELNKIAKKIWGDEPDYQNLPATGLFAYVLLELPSQNQTAVKNLVRRYLFESKEESLINVELLSDIANASIVDQIQEFPDPFQAITYFNKLVIWRKKETLDFIDFLQQEDNIAKLISKVLARSIIPALADSDLNEVNYLKLIEFYNESDEPELLIGFSYFASENRAVAARLEKMISHKLHSKEANDVACASYALLFWREREQTEVLDNLISRLLFVIGSNRITGLQALLWTADELLRKNYLSIENIASLSESLSAIWDSSDYCNITPFSRESISISLVRAACVKLAKSILDKNIKNTTELSRIINEGADDPLPEVKYALENVL